MNLRRAKLYPYERAVLDAVGECLPYEFRARYESQIEAVNKIQRLLAWNEIELYCMSFFKVNWPDKLLFSNKEEIVLGTGLVSCRTFHASFTVWAVGGHVWSIESPQSLKPFSKEPSVRVEMLPGFEAATV